MTNNMSKIKKMTGISIFTAIIIVLQIICTFVKFGPFSITLALAPILVCSALYGKNRPYPSYSEDPVPLAGS